MNATPLQREPARFTARKAVTSQHAALILKHNILVRTIARRLARRLPRHVEVEDLFQAGMVGLLEAANNYSPHKNASFETFAQIRIRGAMLDYMRKGDWTPRRIYRERRELTQAIDRVENATCEAARPAEVAAALGVSLEAYHRIARDSDACRIVSADETLPGRSVSHLDNFPDERADPAAELETEVLRQVLAAGINALPDRERVILILYYNEELCLREIGEKLRLTEARICQICTCAIQRLRKSVQQYAHASCRDSCQAGQNARAKKE